jgi:CheY-like chemotaxis protein
MKEPFEILLVEDYEPDVQLMLRLFRKNRIANRLHVVHDGIQALDFVFCRGAFRQRTSGNPPLVVLLDIRLPKVDGWEVLRQIRNDPRTRQTQVIMISGSPFSAEQDKARQLNTHACLVKPVRIEDLREALASFGYVWTMVEEKGV